MYVPVKLLSATAATEHAYSSPSSTSSTNYTRCSAAYFSELPSKFSVVGFGAPLALVFVLVIVAGSLFCLSFNHGLGAIVGRGWYLQVFRHSLLSL